MRVPFTLLGKRYSYYKKNIIKNFNNISLKGDFILGKNVEILEKKISKICQSKYAISVNSGFDALFLSLKCLGINKGDEVITVSNSYIATASSIVAVGAKPVFIDVGDDYNIDPELIEKKINYKTKAIMPVHLTGNPCNMTKICKLAKKYKLKIIEDSAQAIGASFENKKVGTFGEFGCFSLHPVKNFHVFGDGGIILTQKKEHYKTIKLLRNHGHKNRDEISIWGYNSRLDSVQAGIALGMIKDFSKWNKKINTIANYYRLNILDPVKHQKINQNAKSVFHNYIIQVPKRDKLKKYLLKNGIDTRIHYPIPIHKQKMFKKKNINFNLKNTEKQSRNIISLPIYPEIKMSQIKYIVTKINEFYKK
tara:strand:+ start:5963 stop:7057 length:1095 start_codon:yes stop_codon:yes gene_type:complete